MNRVRNTSVYHIRRANRERWEVLQGSSGVLVASFSDKHSALAFAMNLAHGNSSSGLQEALNSVFGGRDSGAPEVHRR
jgi:hypothetical protein